MTDAYYTRIEEPLQARKQVLETSRIVVLLLQRFESLQEKRKQKITLVEKLKGILKETHDLLDELKKALPQLKLQPKIEQTAKNEKKAEKLVKTRDLDKIEAELKKLEIKLKAMS